MTHDLNALAVRAVDGDRDALGQLCRGLHDRLFPLCLRMLGRHALAEEATQDVMVKVVTRLSSFEGRSAITTWAHTIAVRHVRDLLRKRHPEPTMNEEGFDQLLEAGLAYGKQQPPPTPEDDAFLTEVRLSCTQGMLQILSMEERLALVLVDLLGLNATEAAQVAETSSATLRKRLSRGRQRLAAYLQHRCGVVQPDAACRCRAQIPAKRARGMSADRLPFTDVVLGDLKLAEAHDELKSVRTLHHAFGRAGHWSAPARLRRRLIELLPTVLR